MAQPGGALLQQFMQHLSTVFVSGQSAILVASIPLGPDHPYWTPIQQSVTKVPPSALAPEAIFHLTSAIPASARDTYAAFVAAVLDNLNPLHQATPIGEDAIRTKAYGDFTRLLAVYTELNRLYGMSANGPYLHPFLNKLVLEMAKRILPVSRRAAALATSPSRDHDSSRSIKDTTRQAIERSFQVASSPVASSEWESEIGRGDFVGDVVWSLANILWRIYAERKLHTQAVELRRSVQSLTPPEDRRLAMRGQHVRQADVCESWYWRGRLEVILLDMRGAKASLDRAWELCPESGWKQRRSILMRLIPINLLLGHLPRPDILTTYNLPEYVDLIRAFRTGDIAAWRRELEKRREWLRSRSVWLVLFERGEILVWRNLFREALRLYYTLDPGTTRSRCPTWIFVSAASRAFEGSSEVEDGTIVLEDVICVISSLIDQGLILGYISYSQQTLVMKPSPDGMGGFPRISMVVPRTVTAIA